MRKQQRSVEETRREAEKGGGRGHGLEDPSPKIMLKHLGCLFDGV